VVGTADVGLEPDAVAVNPDATLALVANFGDNTVTPLALPSLRPGRPIAVGKQPVAVAVSPKGTVALVSNYADGTVSPISLPALVAGSPIAAGQEPVALVFTPSGSTALVADFQTSSVTPIAVSSLTPGPAIAVTGNPTGIATLSTSTSVYVSGGDSVTPIDLRTGRARSAIRVGSIAEGLALAPGGGAAWVAGLDGRLIHVDLQSRRVIGSVTVGGHPSAVVIAGFEQPTG
jgi:hyaluronoglucosaminidase